MFHSARWNHDYDLTGKRVAVIGTGASAIQFVPQIQPKVKELFVFQRTAPWVLPKPDRPFHQFEQALFKKLPLWDRLYRGLIYWKNESRALAFTRFSWILDLFAHQARKEARRWVTDPDKLHHLIPDYRIGCKRILISNDWYRAVNQPHANLLTDGIARIDETGIVSETGEHRPADIIIFGTGVRAREFLSPITLARR